MSALENYDGFCGLIHRGACSEQQVRCKYEFGHQGDHSWSKLQQSYPIRFFIHDTTLDKK